MSSVINPRRACAARITVVVLCVCVSVCLSVCYHSSGGMVHVYAPTNWILIKMLRSEVMASFAYHESHQRYYRDPELIPSMARGCKVVQKPNRTLNATWNTS